MNKKSIIIVVAILIVIGAFLLYRQSNLNKLESAKNEITQKTDGPVCVDEYDPVCGVDNKTHSNECVATKIDNVQVQYKGQCKDKETIEDITTISDSSTGFDSGENTIINLAGDSDNISNSGVVNSSSGIVTASGQLDGIKLHNYENSNFNYGFSLPYNTFFVGYGSQGGSSHSVGINTGSGIASFEECAVKTYYYKGKILSELENVEDGGIITDKENGRVYLRIGDNSLIIEAKDGNDTIVQTILKTIYAK